MSHTLRRFWPILVLAVLAAGGCKSLVPASALDTGSVAFVVHLQDGPKAAAVNIDHLTATLTRNQQTRTLDFAIDGATATATVSNLFVGDWDLHVEALTSDGRAAFAADGSIRVLPAQTTSANLTLTPVSPTLNVHIDLSLIPNGDLVDQARLYVDDHYQSFDRPSGATTIDVAKEVEPGTHDYQIILYAGGTAADNIVYEGAYQTITLAPGDVAHVDYEPLTGQFALDGTIDDQPPAPTGVTAAYATGTATIAWDPVTAVDLAGYAILERSDSLAEFEQLDQTDQTTYTYTLPASAAGEHIEYAVVSLDQSGYLSPRSETVAIDVPTA